MGWITPAQLDGRTLKPGTTVQLTTPALTRSSAHGIRIVPDWCVTSAPSARLMLQHVVTTAPSGAHIPCAMCQTRLQA